MKVYNNIFEITRKFNNASVTIGNFDGVHVGHQALFKKVVSISRKSGGDTVAITFEPHPLKVLRPDNPPKRISSLEHKKELIFRSGIEHLIIHPFSMEFARIPAMDFVKEILMEKIGVKNLVVGFDYAFGKGREGNTEFLKDAGRELGFSVYVVEPVLIDGIVASSTKVRELVSLGEMRKVHKILGRYYQIRGDVMVGQKRGGAVVGFPTANLHLDPEDLCPKPGVYVVQVIHDYSCYGGVMNIGRNPTFGDEDLRAEAHIFDFDKDIYGHPIKINLIQRIRGERRFESVEALARQIAKDVETAQKTLLMEKGLKKACMEG